MSQHFLVPTYQKIYPQFRSCQITEKQLGRGHQAHRAQIQRPETPGKRLVCLEKGKKSTISNTQIEPLTKPKLNPINCTA